MRRAAALWLALATPAAADLITRADLIEPTARYDHAVLGDALEWGALRLTGPSGQLVVRLPATRVFEDVEARLIRLEDGSDAVLVAETDLRLGGSIALYDAQGRKIAATPFIGQPHRWYAPVGAADFDGDGRIDIAYVDRPHLQKDLVFARREAGNLVEFARQPGLTNHRIGDTALASTIRDCPDGPVVVLVDAAWQRLMAVRPDSQRDLGPFTGRSIATTSPCS